MSYLTMGMTGDLGITEEVFNTLRPGLWDQYGKKEGQTYEDWQYGRMSTEEKIEETIAGVEDPFSIDWETGIVTDEAGEVIKDYGDLYAGVEEARTTDIPGLDEWMGEREFYDPMAVDETGAFTNQTMQDMQALIDQLTTGPTAMELSDAQAYAAQLMGIDPNDYQSIVGGLLQTATADIGSLQGMSDEERALRERANRNELRNMEERAGRMIESIQASTGSSSRAYAAADQAIGQINDAQIQQSLAIADEEYRRKLNQSESAERQWAAMVQAGQMGQAQYLQLLTQSKSMAFQGYALQVNTMMQQNQQYLQQYGADLQAIEMNINNIYKAINAEIGIDVAMMDFVNQQYDTAMAPVLFELNNLYNDLQMEAADEATKWSNIFSFLSIGVSLLAIPFTGGLSAVAIPAIVDQYEH